MIQILICSFILLDILILIVVVVFITFLLWYHPVYLTFSLSIPLCPIWLRMTHCVQPCQMLTSTIGSIC